MKDLLIRLLYASGPTGIGLSAINYGYNRAGWLLIGVSIGLAMAIIWRAVREAWEAA